MSFPKLILVQQHFDNLELGFPGPNRPAVRYLYFRFILTYLYWLNREEKEGKGGLDWSRDLEKEGVVWAVPGQWLRGKFMNKLSRSICGKDLPLKVLMGCTFDDIEDVNPVSTTEEDRFAKSLRMNLLANLFHKKPERLNKTRNGILRG